MSLQYKLPVNVWCFYPAHITKTFFDANPLDYRLLDHFKPNLAQMFGKSSECFNVIRLNHSHPPPHPLGRPHPNSTKWHLMCYNQTWDSLAGQYKEPITFTLHLRPLCSHIHQSSEFPSPPLACQGHPLPTFFNQKLIDSSGETDSQLAASLAAARPVIHLLAPRLTLLS